VVNTMIQLKGDEGAEDVPLWEWLHEVLERLGADGMSSEESAVEGLETVFRVKILDWRRDMTKELNIIDEQRLLDSDLFSARGSKPGTRVRRSDNARSGRDPVPRLPRCFYDQAWLEQQSDNYRRMTLCISEKQFRWFQLVADQKRV
jgi:hypothetical protein